MSGALDTILHPNRWPRGRNVGGSERLASVAAGAVLAVYSLRHRTLRSLLLPVAGTLIVRGISGRCPVNRALGRNSALPRGGHTSPVSSVPRGEGHKVERSVTIARPAAELYGFWRDFSNLPRLMEHLESVTVLDETRSHWVARAPAGRTVSWDAEIHNEIPNELIAWRSLPGADVANAGSVHFTQLPNVRGTAVRLIFSYEPPAGRLGIAIARLFGEAPAQQAADALRRFKAVMEAGEVAAGAGQPVDRGRPEAIDPLR